MLTEKENLDASSRRSSAREKMPDIFVQNPLYEILSKLRGGFEIVAQY
jgi:hypothetical protein